MIESSASQPLIVGAGPVGLAAALFLARDGVRPRIVDAAAAPSTWSKALAVNPRTLDLLEPTGVTEQMLAAGQPMRGGRFYRGQELLGEFLFDKLPAKYPFLLALSQGATVRLLEAALRQQGVEVEWNTRLVHCRNAGDHVQADLTRGDDPAAETTQHPWLLAADGAHSVARHDLNLAFDGRNFPRPWYLADVPLATSLEDDRAHAFFRPGGGFLFLIRVIGDPVLANAAGKPLWRVISDHENPLEWLESANPAGPAVWTSSFHIAHRVAARFQEGQIYLAGDAAHVHSPIGARGMNLGIEDAWVFAQLHKAGQLARYDDLRRKVDRRVVKRVERISQITVGQSALARAVRSTALPLLMKASPMRKLFMRTATGLDHPLPKIP